MVTVNNAINNTVGAANSGVTNTFTLTNSSNTASSQANEIINVGGGTAGDPFTTYTITGVTNWSQGIDNSVTGDPYVISASTALGTTDTVNITTAGAMTKPLQPSFLASLTASANNVTGNGGLYTLSTNGGGTLTEIFDQGSNFNPTTGAFTAPVTGNYYFFSRFYLDQLAVANTALSTTISSAGSSAQISQGGIINAGAAKDINSQLGILTETFIRLVAGDTVTTVIGVSGGVGNTVDIISAASPTYLTYFGGWLVC